MRVTERTQSLISQLNLARSQSAVADSQRQASTGLRVEQASDDPVGAAQMLALSSQLAAAAQYRENIASAENEAGTAENALGSAEDLLVRARELATQMANGSYGAAERADAAKEIDGIREQMLSLANTRYGDVYVFGGHQTDVKPFDPTGAPQGDNGARQVLAGNALNVRYNVAGNEVFTPATGTNVFATLATLSADLSSNNVAGIQNATSTLETARTQISSAQSELGSAISRLQSLDAIADDSMIHLSSARSRISDADAITSISELARAQETLTATVKVSASMLSTLTLVDKL